MAQRRRLKAVKKKLPQKLNVNLFFLSCSKSSGRFPKHTNSYLYSRLRNPTLTNREKNCRQGRFAAETRQSRGRQRIS
jgi:hypothetical protein